MLFLRLLYTEKINLNRRVMTHYECKKVKKSVRKNKILLEKEVVDLKIKIVLNKRGTAVNRSRWLAAMQ